jgi:polyhydroxybutyrate depolymerase
MTTRRHVVTAVMSLVGPLLLGCTGTSVTTSPSTAPRAPSAEPSAVPSPRSSGQIRDFVVGGDRAVTVQVPPGLDPRLPAPVLVLLHGFGGSGGDQEGYMRFGPVAARRGMLYLHPDGTRDANGHTFWNATDACCDVDRSGVDDSSYLAGLITEIERHVAVDPRRIYVAGHSNGAFMSYRMACDHADTVAAIVSLAGASFADREACRPKAPVTILQIQGTADDVVRGGGGSLAGMLDPGDDRLGDYPSTAASLTAWAGYDGCKGDLQRTTSLLDLDRSLQGTNGPEETLESAYGDCHDGTSVGLWAIEGGGHDPDLSAGFATTVIDYLLAHPKPG